jgi:hypothetical protein
LLTQTDRALPATSVDSTSAAPARDINKNGIELQTIVCASKEQVSCDLLGEAVILDLKNGIYYGLDEVGARIWTLVQQPRRVQEILETLISEYDVETERCESDLLSLLRELKRRGLVEEGNAPNPETP